MGENGQTVISVGEYTPIDCEMLGADAVATQVKAEPTDDPAPLPLRLSSEQIESGMFDTPPPSRNLAADLNAAPIPAASTSTNPLPIPTASSSNPLSRVAQLTKRIEANPLDGEARLALIVDAESKGDLERTREIYEDFLKVFPDAVRPHLPIYFNAVLMSWRRCSVDSMDRLRLARTLPFPLPPRRSHLRPLSHSLSFDPALEVLPRLHPTSESDRRVEHGRWSRSERGHWEEFRIRFGSCWDGQGSWRTLERIHRVSESRRGSSYHFERVLERADGSTDRIVGIGKINNEWMFYEKPTNELSASRSTTSNRSGRSIISSKMDSTK